MGNMIGEVINSARAGVLDVDDFYSELVDPEEFIRIFNQERDTIERAEIVPPKLGEGGFGRIRVVRKRPVYKVNWGTLIKR